MDILIAGVGGQGTLLASRVLGAYAVKKGLDCKLSEVHGMAQRGGSVITFVRMGEKIFSPVIEPNGADYIIAFEKLEALRYAHYLKENGKILFSSQEIKPMPVVIGAEKYPFDIEQKLKGAIVLDALSLAVLAGTSRASNSVMLGAFTKAANLDYEEMLEVLVNNIPQKTIEVNKKAFELGFNH